MRRTVLAAVLAGTMFFTATAAQAGGWHGGYGRGGYGYGHHHNNGLGIALGVTGAFLGTAILVDALSRPRYVVPATAYYYPPPPPVYYQSPPVVAAPSSDAYAAGYNAGLADGQRYNQGRRQAWEDRVDYGLGGRRAPSSDDPYYGR
jgi:hypothetical protein